MIVGRILPIFVFCTVAYTEQSKCWHFGKRLPFFYSRSSRFSLTLCLLHVINNVVSKRNKVYLLFRKILVTFIYYIKARVSVGDNCDVKSTRKSGTCKLLSDCALVEQQAREGLSPTICGFHHHTDVIVCCESTFHKYFCVFLVMCEHF